MVRYALEWAVSGTNRPGWQRSQSRPNVSILEGNSWTLGFGPDLVVPVHNILSLAYCRRRNFCSDSVVSVPQYNVVSAGMTMMMMERVASRWDSAVVGDMF